jgi:hypothetical protein
MRHDPGIRNRRFSMLEVADLMQLKNRGAKERRRHVKRLIRRLERRDAASYLHADTPGGKLYVTLAALEQLIPWDRGTLAKMRGDLDELGTRVKRVEKRVTVTEKDIVRMGEFQKRAAELLADVANWRGQKGAKRGQPLHE